MINITESAIKKIIEFKNNSLYLRISVKGGGCSGLKYNLEFTDTVNTNDVVNNYGNLDVLVDQKSHSFLKGMELDYLNGLKASGFKFSNPNAVKTCGCGESFCN